MGLSKVLQLINSASSAVLLRKGNSDKIAQTAHRIFRKDGSDNTIMILI